MLKHFMAVVVLSLFFVACGPVHGDQCSSDNEGRAACSPDGRQILMCRNATFVGYNCAGGCTQPGARVFCNFEGAKEGDGCPPEFADTVALCENSKSRIVCKAPGIFKAEVCPTECTTSTGADGSPQSLCK